MLALYVHATVLFSESYYYTKKLLPLTNSYKTGHIVSNQCPDYFIIIINGDTLPLRYIWNQLPYAFTILRLHFSFPVECTDLQGTYILYSMYTFVYCAGDILAIAGYILDKMIYIAAYGYWPKCLLHSTWLHNLLGWPHQLCWDDWEICGDCYLTDPQNVVNLIQRVGRSPLKECGQPYPKVEV